MTLSFIFYREIITHTYVDRCTRVHLSHSAGY